MASYVQHEATAQHAETHNTVKYTVAATAQHAAHGNTEHWHTEWHQLYYMSDCTACGNT